MSSAAGGGFGEIMSQLQNLQDQIAGVGSEEEVSGSAGGGAVTVRVRGDLEFTAVHIDPSVVDPDDVATLEDLVLAAVRDAAANLTRARQQAIGEAMGGALSGLFGALAGAGSAWGDDDLGDDDWEADGEEEGEEEGGEEQTAELTVELTERGRPATGDQARTPPGDEAGGPAGPGGGKP